MSHRPENEFGYNLGMITRSVATVKSIKFALLQFLWESFAKCVEQNYADSKENKQAQICPSYEQYILAATILVELCRILRFQHQGV